MQITCFGIDWSEVNKRSSAQAVVDEMILTDDIDIYATYLPDELWESDSYMQHSECADELEAMREQQSDPEANHLSSVCQIISTGRAIDELNICDLTDGCDFLSMGPDRVVEFSEHFRVFRQSLLFGNLSDETKAWVDQWGSALEFFAAKRLGLIGHVG